MTQPRHWRRGPDGQVVRVRPGRSGGPGTRTSAQGEATRPAGKKRARLGLALRLGFRDTYDYLGSVLLMSLLWVTAASAAAVGGQGLGAFLLSGFILGPTPALARFLAGLSGLAGLVLVGGPLTAGFFRFARNAAARESPEIFDLAWGFRGALPRSLSLAAVQAAVAVVLAADCYVFFSQREPRWMAVGVVFLYALAFWGMMSLYAWPLLAEQEIGTVKILKKAALLVLDNFGYTLLLAAVLLLLGTVLWGTLIAALLLWAGSMAILLTQATRELLRKYDVLPPDPTLDPASGETHEFGGHGWHE